MAESDRVDGQRAFGADPANYDRARPSYPQAIYDLLCQRCGLHPQTRTFEIGPGTGQATRHLLQRGADPLVVIEPDDRLAAFLTNAANPLSSHIEVKIASFEEVQLPWAWFDLGVSATSFHWLDPQTALDKVARLLRPGGWWAMWWNVFGDPTRPDEFHEATQDLFASLEGGSPAGAQRQSFALDVDARVGDLVSVVQFDSIASEMIRWSISLDTQQVKQLYATFSAISRLPVEERQRLLDGLEQVADNRFGGRVERPMVTPIYTARRQEA
jgi:SAM-dependent methyltransferase